MSEDMKAVVEIEDADFGDHTQSDWALVDFYATWCPHCKAFRPHYDAAAQKNEGPVRFYAADVDRTGDAADRLEIKSIPTIVLLRDGEKVDAHTGVMKPDDLVAWLGKAVGS